MFGTNLITKANYETDFITVKSIFYTIQGEGPFTGHPAIFCRLSGCNLKCWFCDTDFEGGEQMTANLLSAKLSLMANDTGARLIVITGGEPMIQNIGALCTTLLDSGYTVQIETSGSSSAPGLPYGEKRFHVVCSPKTGSVHVDMQHATAWKYVVRVGGVAVYDGLPCVSYQIKGAERPVAMARPLNKSRVYLTPMDEQDTWRTQANVKLVAELCLTHGYVANLQIHKLLGVA